MAAIYDLVKGNQIHAVGEQAVVLEVARHMVAANIGAVAVLRDSELVGIFTERDLLKRVVAEGRDPALTRVGEVMTVNVLAVAPNQSIDDCMLLMKQNSVRHLPICDGRTLKGMVSLRDLLLHDVEQKDGEVKFMRAYITACS
jgi:signal-transduction protein with cAMP-binding, CBS, and nucleotidyltransferase domain